MLALEFLDPVEMCFRQLDLLAQDAAQLGDHGFAEDELVIRQDMSQDVRAQSARGERAPRGWYRGRPSRNVAEDVLVGQVATRLGERHDLAAQVLEVHQREMAPQPLSPGEWSVEAYASGFQLVERRIVLGHDVHEPLRFELGEVGTASGLVLDPHGRPAAGATVTEPNRDYTRSIPTTDEAGRFSMRAISALPRIQAEKWPDAPSAVVELAVASGASVEGVVLRLREACRLSVQVLDEQGRPAPGVRVWIEGRDREARAAKIRAADAGDSRAAADVTHWLLPARHRPRRLVLARRYAEMALSGEDSEAADWAAVCFLYSDSCGGWEDPRGNGADPKWAIRILRRLAHAGNVHSMHSLYLAYWRGAGVARDVDAAERWARRGAKRGDCEPLNSIGVSFREGKGVRRDIRRAVRCYRTASALGDPFALRNLSKCYEHGEGVRQDDRESVRHLRRAVRLNLRRRPAPCTSAWADLGWRFVRGHGVRKDRARGLRLIRRAAKADWEGAREMLRDLGLS